MNRKYSLPCAVSKTKMQCEKKALSLATDDSHDCLLCAGPMRSGNALRAAIVAAGTGAGASAAFACKASTDFSSNLPEYTFAWYNSRSSLVSLHDESIKGGCS